MLLAGLVMDKGLAYGTKLISGTMDPPPPPWSYRRMTTTPYDTIRKLDDELGEQWGYGDDCLIENDFTFDEPNPSITDTTLAANVWFFENHRSLGLDVIEALSFMNWYVLVKDRLMALAKNEDPKVLSSIPKPPKQALDYLKEHDFNLNKLTMLFG